MNYIHLPPNEGNTRTINCSLRLNPRKNVFNGPFANVALTLDRKFAGSIARCVATVGYDKRIDGKILRYNHTGQALKDFRNQILTTFLSHPEIPMERIITGILRERRGDLSILLGRLMKQRKEAQYVMFHWRNNAKTGFSYADARNATAMKATFYEKFPDREECTMVSPRYYQDDLYFYAVPRNRDGATPLLDIDAALSNLNEVIGVLDQVETLKTEAAIRRHRQRRVTPRLDEVRRKEGAMNKAQNELDFWMQADMDYIVQQREVHRQKFVDAVAELRDAERRLREAEDDLSSIIFALNPSAGGEEE